MFKVGATQVTVAVPLALWVSTTLIEKAGKDVLTPPAEALMTIFGYEPTCAVFGVPESSPVVVLKLAQLGSPAMEKVRVSPALSLAVGTKA